MSIHQRLKEAFGKVKRDIMRTRQSLTDALFSLSNEYAKLQLRIQDLEKRVEELEVQQAETGAEARYSYAKGY